MADTEAALQLIIPTDDMEDKHALRSSRGGRLLTCNNSISSLDAYVLCRRFTSCALGITKAADTDDNNKVLALHINSK